jgi:hypothetical protein
MLDRPIVCRDSSTSKLRVTKLSAPISIVCINSIVVPSRCSYPKMKWDKVPDNKRILNKGGTYVSCEQSLPDSAAESAIRPRTARQPSKATL